MISYRVILIEEKSLMLERLSSVVRNARNFDLMARYTSPQEALDQSAVFDPSLIILDTDADGNISYIPIIRKQFPAASLLCCGAHWNAQDASQMVHAGAIGYIIKPFSGSELTKAVESFNVNNIGAYSEVTAFFSPKGKSGKTTLIANLALSLARKTNEKVGIIDADLQFGDMAVFFNLKPQSTIVEAVRDIKFLSPSTLNSYFIPINKNISLLCGTKRPEFAEHVTMQPFSEMIRMARHLFRYILIDLPPAFNPISITAAESADKTYIVAMNNGGTELQHMQRALTIFHDAWPDNFQKRLHIAFTRLPITSSVKGYIENVLHRPLDAAIPNEYALVSAAANNGRMAVDLAPDSEFAASIDRLADVMRGQSDLRWETL
ncbi:AAA family ATPase [Pectinatus frisingensis]|jgi:pilus assembly protein CpaE|uniref:AAA family ATPase n=1 Tax=Pectinatus frisingensis TaxID=865 RepID=UPI0018C52609|nr:AAA family ATPase [Pectinatus frisingensis]